LQKGFPVCDYVSMSQTVTITEQVTTPFRGCKVNREGGYIDDVLICGLSSKNGRDYLSEAFGDGKIYEGKTVYTNHSKNERQIQEKVGWFSHVTMREGRPYGRFNVYKEHRDAAHLYEIAERNPSDIGMSHVAKCSTRRGDNGREVVESIQEVISVDLVATPATTKGLHESTNGKPLTSFLPKHTKKSGVTAVEETPAMLPELPGDAPTETTGAGDPVKDAMVQAMHALVDSFAAGELDDAGLISKVKELCKVHSKLSDTGEPVEEPSEIDAEEEPEPDEESDTTTSDALSESIELAVKYNIAPSKIQTLAKIQSPAVREQVAKDMAAISAILKPAKSVKRESYVRESSDTSIPDDAKSFAEYLKN
jgi:hypothetical protein